MGLLDSIGSAFKSVTSAIGPAISGAIQSLAPAVTGAATSLLKQVTSGFDGLVNVAKGALSNLPGPFGALASKFLGPIADQLKSGVGGGIQGLLKDLLGKLTGRQLEDGSNVTTPPLAQRDFGSEISNIANVLKEILAKLNGGGTGTTGTGATGTTGGNTGTVPSGTTTGGTTTGGTTGTGGGTGSVSDILKSGLAANSAEFSAEQQTMLDNVTDPKQKAMMSAQFKMQNMQEVVSFISNMMKKASEISQALIQNLK
jgi:hypothetical protein